MIFKLQQTLNPGAGRVLVYNEDRSIFLEAPLRADINKAFRGRAKIYFEGEMVDDEIVIFHEVDEQSW
jgi:hypothetical protein